MTSIATVLTVMGVLAIGIGSFLLHDRRRGYRPVAMVAEGAGGAALGVSWLVGTFGPSNAVDCYAPGANCPETFLGFVWFVAGDGVKETGWAFLAFVVGWVVANVQPSQGDCDYSRVDSVFGDALPSFGPSRRTAQTANSVRALRPLRPSPTARQAAPAWERVTINDKVVHLRGPGGRTACGRMLTDHRPAGPATPMCKLCVKRSEAPG